MTTAQLAVIADWCSEHGWLPPQSCWEYPGLFHIGTPRNLDETAGLIALREAGFDRYPLIPTPRTRYVDHIEKRIRVVPCGSRGLAEEARTRQRSSNSRDA